MRRVRTTVDLPAAVRRRAELLARERRQSLSSVLADLVALGLDRVGEPVAQTTRPRTGFPTVTVGRPVTAADVAELLDDE
jgi:hypothetical protein